MENLNIRMIVSESGVTYRQIAHELSISSTYLSRIMSKPLSPKYKISILKAIEKIKTGGDSIERNI